MSLAKENVLCKNDDEKQQLSNDAKNSQSNSGITLPFSLTKSNREHNENKSGITFDLQKFQDDAKEQRQYLRKFINGDGIPQQISSTTAVPAIEPLLIPRLASNTMPILISTSTSASSSYDEPDSPRDTSFPVLQKSYKRLKRPSTLWETEPIITKKVMYKNTFVATPKSGLKIQVDHDSPDTFKGSRIIGQTTPLPGSKSTESAFGDEDAEGCDLDDSSSDDTETHSLPINVLKSLA